MKNPSESFRVKKRRVVFSKGPIHLVDCEVLMPNGRLLKRQILEHPGAVVIVPEIRPGRLLLIRQFRFATKGWIWEFPAGGIEKGESLTQTARRELIEEVGYRPNRLRKMVEFYPTPGVSGEIMYLFLAQKLSPESADGDEDEEIEVHEFSLSQIEKMIRKGEIIDAKTILGFFYANARLRSRTSSADQKRSKRQVKKLLYHTPKKN